MKENDYRHPFVDESVLYFLSHSLLIFSASLKGFHKLQALNTLNIKIIVSLAVFVGGTMTGHPGKTRLQKRDRLV